MLCNYIYNKSLLKICRVSVSEWVINGRIFIRNRGSISLGNGFVGNSGAMYNPVFGECNLTIVAGLNAKIEIGCGVKISNAMIYARECIVIEENVFIGGGVKIWDTNFHSLDHKHRGNASDSEFTLSAPVYVKNNVFIGAGSIILKGVTIGERSIIGAGSVVTKSVPDDVIWGGNPACFIRNLEKNEIQ